MSSTSAAQPASSVTSRWHESGRLAQLGGRRPAPLVEHVDEYDPRPFVHEAPGDRRARPPGGAGHEGDFAVESMHPGSLQHRTRPFRLHRLRRGPPGCRYEGDGTVAHPRELAHRAADRVGALAIVVGAAVTAAVTGGPVALIVGLVVIGLAALATFAPAIGTLSASVDADTRGVSVRRFGRSTRFAWTDVVDVHVIERRASVPDGTEYHWVMPSRSRHVVAVPCLQLADGRIRQLTALAAPATGPRSAAAREYAALLTHLRALTASTGDPRPDQRARRSRLTLSPAAPTNAAIRSHTNAMSSSVNAWFIGTSMPRSITASAFGSPASG